MLAYRGSDVRFSWDADEYKRIGHKPCAFVKEGLGIFVYFIVCNFLCEIDD